jgi:hypothetical protein
MTPNGRGKKLGQDSPSGTLFKGFPNQPFCTRQVDFHFTQLGTHLDRSDADGVLIVYHIFLI